jgi:uncharacterized surface protein with fasciclin (FAS1) repeats
MSRYLAVLALGLFALAPRSAEGQEAPQDIVATAVAAGSFNTLAAALEAADLVSVLQGEGPFTVFAPTDEAFAKLPEGALDALLADKAALVRVLTYHVVPGRIPASEVVGLNGADTAAGIRAPIEVRMGTVYVGGAPVVATDVPASNGIIHVLGEVMLPPAN